MVEEKKDCEFVGASILVRLAMAAVFAAAAINKFIGGIPQVVGYFELQFAETWLPLFLVKPLAISIAFIESILAIWLLSGFRLVYAWMASGLLMIVLIFGMCVVKQYPIAADNAIYLLVITAGLLLSRYDKFHLG